MLLDLRHAIRRFVREPIFSLAATLVIGLAVGANTSIFTLVNSLLLKELPGVSRQEELVEIGRTQDGEGLETESYPDYRDYRDQNSTLQALAAWTIASLNFRHGEESDRIYGCLVSGNYFTTLGAHPFLGRFFAPEEDATPGTHPVAVLSYAFWQQRLAGDPEITGKSLTLNGQPFTVIGVTQPGFSGTVSPFRPEIWVPLMMQTVAQPGETDAARQADELQNRTSNWLFLFGRLRPASSLSQARADLSTIANRLEEQYPQANRGQGVDLQPLRSLPSIARLPVAVVMTLLFGITGTLLLIAGVNIAGLLLARLMGRSDEFAIRLAVGSSSWRITRQLLTESLLLFCAGGFAGLLFASGFGKLLETFQPPTPIPLQLGGEWDLRVFLFSLLLSLLCGLVFGVFPARFGGREGLLKLVRVNPAGSPKVLRLRSIFVTVQVSLCLSLLFIAGLFLRSLRETASLDLGFDSQGVWVGQIDLSLNGYSDERSLNFYRTFLETAATQAGLDGVALATDLPLDGTRHGLGGIASPEQEQDFIDADFNLVSPGYLELLKMPLLSGRTFNFQDDSASPSKAVLNEKAAERLWPGENPLGKRLLVGETGSAREFDVVGIVASARLTSLSEPPSAQVYLPLLQNPRGAVWVLVKGSGRPVSLARDVLRQLDASIPLVHPVRLSEFNQTATLIQRVAATLSGVVGIAGLALAAIGVFALTSFCAASRIREVGVRLALGAKPRQILTLVGLRGLAPALVGATLGLGLCFIVGGLVKGLLIGVGSGDLAAFAIASGVLLTAVSLAAYLPARQASRMDPMEALRYQ